MSGADWSDRLTTRRTRAGALRTALGAAAAFTLPLSGSAAAHAAGGGSCQKGCLWTAARRADAAFTACEAHALGGTIVAAWMGALGGMVFQYAALSNEFAKVVGCTDRAILEQKSENWGCLQPGCDGFDPTAPGGPCDDCKSNCCACDASASGYICCVFACDDPVHNCCPA